MDTKATNATATVSAAAKPFLPLLGRHETAMIDLHGLSVEQARKQVEHYVTEAPLMGWNKIRFVTGRGNHINARGERGTLYKSFTEWLHAVSGNITKLEQYDGYYEVDIKEDIPVRNPFMALMTKEVEQLLNANIDKIKEGAKKRNADDMSALALCYDKGIGVEKNYQRATKLYLKLADEKSASAQYEVGCRYFIGKGIKQNDAKTIEFLTLSANQGYMLAESLLGNIHWKGFDTFPVNYPLANQYFLKAAKQGHAESARKLGCAYAEGLGISVDYVQAVDWWEKAVAGDDCVAAYNLSFAHREGRGVPRDPKKAFDYLLLAAKHDPDAQSILGYRYYYDDDYVKQDKTEGVRWLQRAADNNCPQAQFLLFIHYRSLNDEVKAKKYLISAAANGHIEAQFLIAMAPKAFDSNLQEQMLQCLLEQPVSAVLQIKNDNLQCNIIDLFLCQDNTKNQIKKGVEILEKLADKKCIDVLDRLGEIYVLGRLKGTKQDIEKGHQYWLQGAAVEDPDCLCALAYFWQEGFGEKVDPQKALEYFFRAAAKGNANANNQIGIFYRNNMFGLRKDPKQAAT